MDGCFYNMCQQSPLGYQHVLNILSNFGLVSLNFRSHSTKILQKEVNIWGYEDPSIIKNYPTTSKEAL